MSILKRCFPLCLLLGVMWGVLVVALPTCSQQTGHLDAPAPQPTTAVQKLLDAAKLQESSKQFTEALKTAETGLKVAREQRDVVGEAACLRSRARMLEAVGKTSEALAAWQEAVTAWERVRDSPGRVEGLLSQGLLLIREKPEQSQALLTQACALAQQESRRPLALSDLMFEASRAYNRIGRFNEAGAILKECLRLDETFAPGSAHLANTLHGLGIVARSRGEFEEAEARDLQALDLRTRLASPPIEFAAIYNSLGIVAQLRGDLIKAGDYYQHALNIVETVAPGSAQVASTLNNLGIVAFSRGDLIRSEDCYRQALALDAKLPGRALAAAGTLNNLGHIAVLRGDLVAAEDDYQRALAIKAKADAGSPDVAVSLAGLGVVARYRGDYAKAEEYDRRALALVENIPHSHEAVSLLSNLGNLALSRNDLAAAEDYAQRALAMHGASASASLDVRANLTILGEVAYARGDFAKAEGYCRRGLSLDPERTPDSLELVDNLALLGKTCLRQSHAEQALPPLMRAAEILERQRRWVASPDARTLFSEQYSEPFRLLLRAYVALNRADLAFETLERMHARSLSDSLAERRFELIRHLPADLRIRQEQLDNRRSIGSRDLQRARERQSHAAEETARRAIALLEAQQRQLDADIRKRDPRYAQLQYPQPLDLKAAQQALAPGVLAFAYAVDEAQTTLFTVTRAGLHHYILPLSAKQLAEKIAAVHTALAQDLPREQYEPLLHELYSTLVLPAQKEIQAAHSLLICPDGPLHLLPFAALMSAHDRYLAQDRPMHIAPSLTAYRDLEAMKSASGTGVLALGDPVYDRVMRQNGEGDLPAQQPGVKMGMPLERLAKTRTLAAAVAALFAPHAEVLLDRQATVANVEAKAGRARIVHLGCHGRADDRDPFGSWLALTPANREDTGLLYAWQVLNLRLHADLVVLGACETGLGVPSRSEGMMGLARAFHLAGARSVLTSLWEVDEEATVSLLLNFYRAWKAGQSKEEALRDAQLKAIARKQRPALWAAFVLNGVGR